MSASTRRAAFGAILAAPLASVPAAAVPLSDLELRLLAIGPRLVALLDEFDQLWPDHESAFEAYQLAAEHLCYSQHAARQALPEWAAYIEARRPADAVHELIDVLYEPFINKPMRSFEAIMLKHRYGMTYEAFREDALFDLDRLWAERGSRAQPKAAA